ncbi:protein Star isoform X1 [Leguminivora glycinivorella]|uniref:protein Star isoform X1 n=1 Tax=Leguminivora glycinivorella TaxID=1035111 RepID=UPI00200D3808|nr:protein Star isoform X1 [Leguminivora glycinivorella]
MAEKKIQENPLPEPAEPAQPKPEPKPRFCMPSFTKTPPQDLYRQLLPAMLFLLTFVTVMTMLLTYMDTFARGAQQFRLNMSRDYELKIPQESDYLVAYVRQWHLGPRPNKETPAPIYTDQAKVLDQLLGEVYNGTFVEILPRGHRDPTTLFLEVERGWSGLAVRAAPRDHLELGGSARTLNACLSPLDHPIQVPFNESDEHDTFFRSRVLCLPLYTVLLAAEATRAHYVLLGGPPHLHHVPFHKVQLKVIEYRSNDELARNQTAQFLLTKNYTVAATFPDSIMFALNH